MQRGDSELPRHNRHETLVVAQGRGGLCMHPKLRMNLAVENDDVGHDSF
jgi:hypothetical protein